MVTIMVVTSMIFALSGFSSRCFRSLFGCGFGIRATTQESEATEQHQE